MIEFGEFIDDPYYLEIIVRRLLRIGVSSQMTKLECYKLWLKRKGKLFYVDWLNGGVGSAMQADEVIALRNAFENYYGRIADDMFAVEKERKEVVDRRIYQKHVEKRREIRRLTKHLIWPEEKQRRSKLDWFAITSRSQAETQIEREKTATAQAMRKAGMSLSKIGRRFGKTPKEVRWILARHVGKGWLWPPNRKLRVKRGFRLWVVPAGTPDRDWIMVA